MSLDHADLAVPAPSDLVPDRARKGRGAISNRVSRYEPETREAVDDGWANGGEDEDLPPLRTSVTIDSTRSIIARNQSPDIGFDRSINPCRRGSISRPGCSPSRTPPRCSTRSCGGRAIVQP